jgi:23S rRNA pseudouridine1911/1915/1917 synthase
VKPDEDTGQEAQGEGTPGTARGETRFTVTREEAGRTLAAAVRAHGWATTWNEARRLVERGKVRVGNEDMSDPAVRLRERQTVELRPHAPRPRETPPGRLVHDDPQVVVLDKPAGFSSVPYEQRETGTAMDLVRAHWRAEGRRATEVPLHVVHRIDKETSGLIVFAKTRLAERVLAAAFRTHAVARTYLCVAHGRVHDQRIESQLVEDRGDGLRGSTNEAHRGKRAVTWVRAREVLGSVATLCEVQLETGKTHQIRIHLAERRHPVVGEKVYIRDFLRHGGTSLESPRLLLHAATLGFVHPTTGLHIQFESPLPPEFVEVIERLQRSGR